MKLPLSLLLFGSPALLFVVLQRYVAPALEASGIPPLAIFFVLATPHLLFFFGALFAYRVEPNAWSWPELAERFRLNPMRRGDWLWAIAGSLGNIGLYLLVYVGARPIVKWLHDLFPEPEVLARVFGDAQSFAGYPLKGNFWLLGAFLAVYFFNVVGEELWWRGYIFPRQEVAYGERTWIVHGLLWAGFHIFSPYNAIMVLPGALLLSWIVQRRQNTWIFLIAHASLNALAMIRIVSGILG